MNLLYYHQKSLNIVRSSFYFSPSWLTWLRVKYFRFTFSPVHRSRCNPHYLAQNSRCCQVIFKNRPVKCAIRWRRDTTGLTGLVRHKLVTETVPLSYRLSSLKQRSVDESIRWNTLIYSYHTGSPICFDWPAAWTVSVWEEASTHTTGPSSVCNAPTSLQAPSKLLFSEVSQIENEGNQRRTTWRSQRPDAESTRSQLKISVCCFFFLSRS